MKMFYGLVATLLCLICVVSAFPASPVSDEVELIAPTPARRPIHRPSVLPGVQLADDDGFNVESILTPSFDTGNISPFLGLDFGFIDRIQKLFNTRYGPFVPTVDTDSTDPDSVVGTEVDTKTDDDGSTTKTTSTIQIINGRKYRINDTVTTRNLGFGQSIFKVRTVNLVSDDDADTESTGQPGTTAAPANEDVSTTAASGPVAPELSTDTKPNRKDVTESSAPVGEADAMEPEAAGSPEVLDPDYRQNEINARNSRNGRVEHNEGNFEDGIEGADFQSIESVDQPSHLSALVVPPFEWIAANAYHLEDGRLVSNSQRDIYDTVPGHNLAADIAVNEMLADQGAEPLQDPDAELLVEHRSPDWLGER